MKTYVPNDRIIKIKISDDGNKIKIEGKEDTTNTVKEVHLLQE